MDNDYDLEFLELIGSDDGRQGIWSLIEDIEGDDHIDIGNFGRIDGENLARWQLKVGEHGACELEGCGD